MVDKLVVRITESIPDSFAPYLSPPRIGATFLVDDGCPRLENLGGRGLLSEVLDCPQMAQIYAERSRDL